MNIFRILYFIITMEVTNKLKKIGSHIATGVKKTITEAQENAKENAERRELKRRLLSYFTRSQLDGLLKQYGYTPLPEFKKDPITDEKVKITMDDRIDYCINKIPLKNMLTFAKNYLKNNPYVRDVIIEADDWLKRVDHNKSLKQGFANQQITSEGNSLQAAQGAELDLELTKLLNEIKVEFEEDVGDQTYNTEDEFNKSLVAWLRSRYKSKIEDMHNIHTGHSGDIVYEGENGKYVLELKLAYGGSLDYGFKEIAEYKYSREFNGIGVIIWDNGQMPYDSLKKEQNKLELLGAKVIIIEPKTK